MHVTRGIDWAEDHPDVAMVDSDARLLGKPRISDDAAGFQDLLRLLAEHGDSPHKPIPIAIKTSRGLLVTCLRASGRRVFAINPMAVARHATGTSSPARDGPSGRLSPGGHPAARRRAPPAAVGRLRPGQSDRRPRQSPTGRGLGPHRGPQSAAFAPTRVLPGGSGGVHIKRVRLVSREARAILAIAPTPAEAIGLTRQRLKADATKAGRRRRIEDETDRLLKVIHRTWLRQPALVETAMGRRPLALLTQREAACRACGDLARDSEELFLQHPDAEIIMRFPGHAVPTGARIPAETGDDRTRFNAARDLKAYAGSAPVTRESSKSRRVRHHRVKNSRSAATGRHWAFAALTSRCPRPHHNHRRDTGDRYYAALRHLFNRMLGQLRRRLTFRQRSDEAITFSPPMPSTLAAAA